MTAYGVIRRLTSVVALAALAGCATEVYRVPTQFSPAAAGERIVMAREVSVTPSTGYTRVIKAGSRWRYVGRVPQGKVYAVQDDVFMLEGKNMHEAYCVVDDRSMLVGFYLPVEQAFAPLTPPVALFFK